MPTYEYECTQCGARFEEFQSITAKPLRHIKTDCAKCDNKAPVTRLLGTGSAVLFKGSGFYETDYRSDSYKKAAKSERDGEKKGDSKDKKTSDGGDGKKKTEKAPSADVGSLSNRSTGKTKKDAD